MNFEPRTVTLMMTDIVGSTRLWENFPSIMAEVVRRHDELAAIAVANARGKVIKSRGEGDSLFTVFTEAKMAIEAALAFSVALACEKWPGDLQISVRTSIHSGVVDTWEDDFYGPTVNRCARMRGAAAEGQILVSSATAALAEGIQIELRSLGEIQLRDLARPELIFQVVAPGLPKDFPALKGLGAYPTNLPPQFSNFIGREKELGVVRALIQKNRLVTMQALGGAGKSRLALQAVADLSLDFAGGSWYLDVPDAPGFSVLAEFMAVLQLPQPKDLSAAKICEALGDKPTVLLVDHAERSDRDLSRDIEALIRTCPRLHVVVTSRTLLDIPGECVYRVPPLSIPAESRLSVHSALDTDAVQLFLSRARLIKPAFALTPANVVPGRRILVRVDGLPLGIELASARLSVLGVEQLADKLDETFHVLGRGATRVPTMYSIVEWSVRGLSAEDQELFQRFTVFPATADLAAVEAICATETLESWSILDSVDSLVKQSLLRAEDLGDTVRYRMLNAVREFAATTLPPGASDELAQRHVEHFREVAARAADALRNGDQAGYLAVIGAEHDNLRAAVRFAIQFHDSTSASELAADMFRFWEVRGLNLEGRKAIESVLIMPEFDSTTAKAGELFNAIGSLANRQGDYSAASAYHQSALAIRQALGDLRGQAGSLNNLANVANESGDLKEAEAMYLQALAINRESGNLAWEGINLVNLATLSHRQQQYAEAVQFNQASLEAFESAGMTQYRLFPLAGLGNAANAIGDFSGAASTFQEALRMCADSGDRPWSAVCLEGLAFALLRSDKPELAAKCWGQAAAVRTEIDLPLSVADVEEQAAQRDECRRRLGDLNYEAAFEIGAATEWGEFLFQATH